MKALFFFLTTALLWPGIFFTCHTWCDHSFKQNAKTYIEHWEGRRTSVYHDSQDIETIGIGFNLHAHPDLAALVSTQHGFLSAQQIDFFFDKYVTAAIIDARKVFPSFDSQPSVVRLILVDMDYQLGPTGMRSFKKFRAAIEARSYYVAAQELMNSRWAKQSGRRAIDHIETLKNLR